jgi:hypothetical protein
LAALAVPFPGDTDIVEDPNDVASFFLRLGNTKEFVSDIL